MAKPPGQIPGQMARSLITYRGNTVVTYTKGEEYPLPLDTPVADTGFMSIDGSPTFHMLFSAPLDHEARCLAGACTHIGIVPASEFPGGIPVFLFQSDRGEQVCVASPMDAPSPVVANWVNTWGGADSTLTVIFLLIERQTKIIREHRIVEVSHAFREAWVHAALKDRHPIDTRHWEALRAELGSGFDQAIVNAATLWAWNSKTERWEEAKRRDKRSA
jgi:hypothetical protein